MHSANIAGLSEFLADYPFMALRPTGADAGVVIKGQFTFSAEAGRHGTVTESFELLLLVPFKFPKELPIVFETGGRIPRAVDYHINSGGSLCLGSPLRLMLQISKSPTLRDFANDLLVPYLFAISQKLNGIGRMVFDELDHGAPGLFADYGELFGLTADTEILHALSLLGLRKRVANKRACPCG